MSILSIINDLFEKRENPVKETNEKEKSEIEKLKLDIELSKKNLNNFKSQQRLERVKVWLGFITSIIAIGSIFITFSSQQHQIKVIQSQHNDDEYARQVELLAKSTTELSKLASLTALSSSYLSDENNDSDRRRETINLFIEIGENDSSIDKRKNQKTN